MNYNRFTALVLSTLFLFTHLFAVQGANTPTAEPTSPDPKQEILAVAHSMMEAYKKKDLELIKATLTEDFIGTYDGDVWDKKTLLAALKTGDDVVESLVNDDVKIRHYNNTAIMTGQVTAKEIYKGKDISGKHRFTILFVRDGSKWRVASEHWSSIPAEEAEGAPAIG